MADVVETPYFLKEIFPSAGADLLALLEGAIENGFLARNDFYTMRDWMQLADCPEEEVVPALLLLMFTALEEGSLCIELGEPALLARLADFVDAESAWTWATRIVSGIKAPGVKKLIGKSPGDSKPIVEYAANGRRFLYFQKYLRAELDFDRDLKERLNEAPRLPVDAPAILNEVLEKDPLRHGDRVLTLDSDQKLALGAALCNPLTIISGGPGTGKTSIVLTLLRCLVRSGIAVDRIALAAPTGRAAQRLTDSIRTGLAQLSANADTSLRDVTATTLHQLLGYRPTRNLFSRHRENPINADVVIIDEVSMVGLVLMSQLLQALPATTRLILLGDKDQLPSVDAGAVLGHLVPDGYANGFTPDLCETLATLFPKQAIPPAARSFLLEDRVVVLQTNHRSEGRIREAAQAINRQDAGIIERLPIASMAALASLERDGGCRFVEQTHATPNEVRAFVCRWADHAYFHSSLNGTTLAKLVGQLRVEDVPSGEPGLVQLFALLDRFRLLTLVRESAWGSEEINRTLDQYLRPRLDGDERTRLFPGAPVLITRNDATRGLFNGDVGITLRHPRGGLRVVFARQDRVIAFPAESLPAHELGFALTVHKSQGSEYANVMLVLPPAGGKRLLTKEMIYTGITRAKSLALICSTKPVFKAAIERRIVRDSGVLRMN